MQTIEDLQKDALAAAQSWLAYVDGNDFDESWNHAASLFKSVVSQEQWRASLEAAQKPIGKAVSRSFKSAQHAEELPGAPDGKYFVIEYETAFEHKRRGTETVVMMDDDGEWRVSGSFIK
ncbi:MAG: DUF4019 domain-containing protein [Pyrinomonadaceae bacterium]